MGLLYTTWAYGPLSALYLSLTHSLLVSSFCGLVLAVASIEIRLVGIDLVIADLCELLLKLKWLRSLLWSRIVIDTEQILVGSPCLHAGSVDCFLFVEGILLKDRRDDAIASVLQKFLLITIFLLRNSSCERTTPERGRGWWRVRFCFSFWVCIMAAWACLLFEDYNWDWMTTHWSWKPCRT